MRIVRLEKRIINTTKSFKERIVKNFLKKSSHEDLRPRMEEGRRLMIKTAIAKAEGQNLIGKEAQDIRVNAISTMWRCFL